jgi:hypothetical protein
MKATLPPQRRIQRCHLGRAFIIAKSVQDDMGALSCQCLGDSQTNSTGRACDERCFALSMLILRMNYDG